MYNRRALRLSPYPPFSYPPSSTLPPLLSLPLPSLPYPSSPAPLALFPLSLPHKKLKNQIIATWLFFKCINRFEVGSRSRPTFTYRFEK